MNRTHWIACPKCGGKMLKVRDDTKLANFPGYCKKCKSESIITLEPKGLRACEPSC
ncbi:MAG: conjugal transfer protein [Lachnospiraceae bacterium]|nr:conjugal transfer protein [Lachnospiraceae bacterium]